MSLDKWRRIAGALDGVWKILNEGMGDSLRAGDEYDPCRILLDEVEEHVEGRIRFAERGAVSVGETTPE